MKSSVSSKGQVTIPKAVRDHLGLEPGSGVEFLITTEGAVLIRKRFEGAEPLRGALRSYAPKQPVSLDAMNEAVAREAARLEHETRNVEP